MKRLALKSWFLLLYFDWLMRFRGFSRMHTVVRQAEIGSESRIEGSDCARAVDFACVFYFKRVLCLQRSAALTVLLRRFGWKAEMVIGAQLFPFVSHAWVELEGQIINDKPHVTEVFHVLDRC